MFPEAFTVGHSSVSRILVHAFTGRTVNTGMFAVDVRVKGGSRVKISDFLYSDTYKNSEYEGSGTFYGIQKACPAEIW